MDNILWLTVLETWLWLERSLMTRYERKLAETHEIVTQEKLPYLRAGLFRGNDIN